jgi:hypothetical protein
MKAFQSGKQRKVVGTQVIRAGLVEETYVAFGKKLPGEKGSVKRCIVVMQQPVLLWPKVLGEVFAHLHTMWNRLFGLPGQIISEQTR